MKGGFAGQYEVLDDPVGRRIWPDEVKARIVMESFAPGAQVRDVARRHRLLPSQLTGWRRLARQGRLALPIDVPGLSAAAEFVPLMLEKAAVEKPAAERCDERIEIDAGGILIKLPGPVAAARLAEIVAALRSPKT